MSEPETGRPLRIFFAVAAGLALIAGILLFVLAEDTDRFFSWTIEPPLTAASLGAMFWSALVLLGWAALQRSWARAQVVVSPVMLISALLLAATFAHLDRFDFDSVFGWFWVVVYIAVIPFLSYLVWAQRGRLGLTSASAATFPGWLRATLAAQGAVLVGVGALLFAAPGETGWLWPWELTPLTARAIGSWVIGLGVAAALALRETDLERLRGPALAAAALGALELAALAIHADDVTGSAPEVVGYVGFCAGILAVGLYGSRRSARTAASASP